MKLGTIDIIKILPFEEHFKKDLLDRYEFLDEDQKFNIQGVIWDTYNWLFDSKLQENIDLARQLAAKGQEKLDGNFYARIKELTEHEFAAGNVKTIDNADLASTRDKLKGILARLEKEESN